MGDRRFGVKYECTIAPVLAFPLQEPTGEATGLAAAAVLEMYAQQAGRYWGFLVWVALRSS